MPPLLVAPTTSGALNVPITFDIVATGDIGSAVAWGSTVALSDPLKMAYNTSYNGGNLYRNLQPFFDLDLSDASNIGNGILKFNYLNSTPGTNLGTFGYVPLAEFQVNLSAAPSSAFFTVGLGPLGIPPNGSAVQDDQGNNLLVPTDPNHPLDNVATAYITVAPGT